MSYSDRYESAQYLTEQMTVFMRMAGLVFWKKDKDGELKPTRRPKISLLIAPCDLNVRTIRRVFDGEDLNSPSEKLWRIAYVLTRFIQERGEGYWRQLLPNVTQEHLALLRKKESANLLADELHRHILGQLVKAAMRDFSITGDYHELLLGNDQSALTSERTTARTRIKEGRGDKADQQTIDSYDKEYARLKIEDYWGCKYPFNDYQIKMATKRRDRSKCYPMG